MADSLKSFLKIVELDTQINRCSNDKFLFESQIKETVANINELQATIDLNKKTISNSQLKCSNIELEIKEIDDQIRKIKKQLDKIANIKEYNSTQKELLKFEKEKLLKDDILLTCWAETEIQAEVIQEVNKQKNSELSSLKEKITDTENRVTNLIRRIKEYEEEKLIFRDHANKEYMQEYTQMLSLVNNPVVPVIQKACSGCFYSLTNAYISQINDQKIIKCNHCHRLLYSLETI